MHEYCPPIHVDSEVENLLRWLQEYENEDPVIVAAWVHHRFTQIHPFQDGNGRIARALATIVFLRAEYLPLVIRDTEHREKYLDALSQADVGELGALVGLFADIQIRDMSNAIQTLRELRGEGIFKIASSAAQR